MEEKHNPFLVHEHVDNYNPRRQGRTAVMTVRLTCNWKKIDFNFHKYNIPVQIDTPEGDMSSITYPSEKNAIICKMPII